MIGGGNLLERLGIVVCHGGDGGDGSGADGGFAGLGDTADFAADPAEFDVAVAPTTAPTDQVSPAQTQTQDELEIGLMNAFNDRQTAFNPTPVESNSNFTLGSHPSQEDLPGSLLSPDPTVGAPPDSFR